MQGAVRCVLSGQLTCTCCVSIEVAPFLLLFFGESVSSVKSVYVLPCEPGAVIPGSSLRPTMPRRDLSLDLPCHSLHRTTFSGKYDGFTCRKAISLLHATSYWDVSKQGVSLLFHLFRSILVYTYLLMSGGEIPASK